MNMKIHSSNKGLEMFTHSASKLKGPPVLALFKTGSCKKSSLEVNPPACAEAVVEESV